MTADADAELVEEPEATGVVTAQRKASPEQASSLARVRPTAGLSQFPVTDALREMSGFSAPSAKILLIANTQHLEAQVTELREELHETRKQRDTERDRAYAAERDNAVLQERLSAAKRTNDLKQAMITVGSAAVGIGAPFCFTAPTFIACAGTLTGFAFLLAGWLVPASKAKDGGAQ